SDPYRAADDGGRALGPGRRGAVGSVAGSCARTESRFRGGFVRADGLAVPQQVRSSPGAAPAGRLAPVIVVIGAGQAGLAAGRELRAAGHDVLLLDAHDRIGESWRRRWDSLRLFTPARFSALPGMPFPGPPDRYPGKDEVADY